MNQKINLLYTVVNQNDWILAGSNFDEDLHFSSHYIRLCSKKYNKDYGYNTILAFYKDFNEHYYIPQNECKKISNKIINKIKKTPEWIKDVLKEIYKRCNELSTVFSKFKLSEDFSDFSDIELLMLYQLHYQKHYNLYQVALIPETLDRGLHCYTNYLFKYLNKKTNIDDNKKLSKIFNILTTPNRYSIFQLATLDLLRIVELIKKNHEQVELFQKNLARILFKINPILLKKIERYRSKWGFIEYHGYGNRKLPEIDYYFQKIQDIIVNERKLKKFRDHNLLIKEIEKKKKKIIKRYQIDYIHKELFSLYSEIGLTKLYRRFIQLKIFFFLDKLLRQISRKKKIKEGILRCLLPEEIECVIKKKKFKSDTEFKNRQDYCLYLIHNFDNEIIFTGLDVKKINSILKNRNKNRITSSDSNKYCGIIASPGYIKGKCKIIKRYKDSEIKNFEKGDIIISEATDPDLIDLMYIAGGVITQQGGVTSHAAIICREIGIPAIIGVKNLLNIINDNDIVELDANSGTLKILQKCKMGWKYLKFPDLKISNSVVGNKFYNLSKIIKLNFDVPKMFVLDTTELSEIWGSNKKKELITELKNAINLFRFEKYIIRSSFCIEDGFEESKAGFFPTKISIERDRFLKELDLFLKDLLDRFGEFPKGGIIIQEMIEGDYSGICFTTDPITVGSDIMILEVVKGLNYQLTDGLINPSIHIKINTIDYDIVEENVDIKVLREFSWQNIIEIARICKKIEDHFGLPQNIEWTFLKGKFYILQTRPISSINKKN